MAAIHLLLLLASVALSAGAGVTKSDAEMEAEAEGGAAALIERALTAVQAALADSREPWTRRLQAALETLTPLVAALKANTAAVLLNSHRRLDQLRPALEDQLEATRARLVLMQQELTAGAAERGAAALAELAAAVARARDHLASLAPPATAAHPDATEPPADH